MERRCENCEWWVGLLPPRDFWGACRRSPPWPLTEECGEFYGVWAKTCADNWCGEFGAKEKLQEPRMTWEEWREQERVKRKEEPVQEKTILDNIDDFFTKDFTKEDPPKLKAVRDIEGHWKNIPITVLCECGHPRERHRDGGSKPCGACACMVFRPQKPPIFMPDVEEEEM